MQITQAEESGRHLAFLDGWRGMAIIFVLIGHFSPWARQLGGLGVDVFFVLSGRLMARMLIENKAPLPTFFFRRVSRIFPALAVYTGAIAAVSLAATLKGYKFNSIVSPLDVFAALTMWMNYKIWFFGPSGALGHTWSLSVEEHCYVTLAVLAAAFHRARTIWLAVALVACLAAINCIASDPGHVDSTFWRTDIRLTGLFLSFAVALNRGHLARVLKPACLPMFILAVAVTFAPVPMSTQLVVTAICLALSVNGLEYQTRLVVSGLSAEPITRIGTLSYSLYLWQEPFFAMHEKVSSLILLPCTFACAMASYHFVEQPAREFLNRWWATKHRRLPKPSQWLRQQGRHSSS